MDIFKSFSTDLVAEVEGVEVSIGKDAYVTVARSRNDDYLKLMLSEFEKHSDELDGNEELDKELTIIILSKTILKGWRGLEYKGKTIKYSIKNAQKLLAIKDFRRKIVELSDDIELFRVKQEESDVKN